ncbi:MurR/RpiR family transcriptional regulator [Lacrimispora sp. 38-1]|uniref:MurR/RpiR family transcriptional regulator n=1 Tax=Lacrimispora sp. 38-1 TaxID=3125778 RepID=UPI003CED8220
MGILLNRLLIILNDSDLNSTDYHIAFTLLSNFYLINEMSIGAVADLCSVSKSTISKFIRKLHFEDYSEFRAAAPFVENRSGFNLNYNRNIAEYIEQNNIDSYIDCILDDISACKKNIDMDKVRELAGYLVSYRKVASFGLLFSELGAMDLQAKLAYNGKFIITNLNDVKQDDYINNAGDDSLIIIYSNSGSYIQQYMLSEFHTKKDYSKIKAKIVLITGNAKMENHPNVDLCISFTHNSIVQTHSVIYPLINDIIIMEYRKLTRKR